MGNYWPTAEEIAYALQSSGTGLSTGGAVLRYRNGQMLCAGGESHTLYLGTTGCGKTTRGTIPLAHNLIDTGEAMIVADSKGLIYSATAPHALAAGYTVYVYNFRNPKESNHWNPLAAPYQKYKNGDRQGAGEMIETDAHSHYQCKEKADPFWPLSARSLYNGAVRTLFEHAQPEQINMASVCNLVTGGNERVGGIPCLRSLVKEMPADSIAAQQMQSYVTTANDTQAGIRSVFLEGLSPFVRNEGMLEMLSSDDLHISEMTGNEKIAVYLIIPDETPIYGEVAGTLINQLMFHFIHLAEDKCQGRLPLTHHFLLEEMGNIAHAIPHLSYLLSAGRSRNIRVHYVLQNLSQLSHAYGEADAETILSNTDVIIAFRTNNWNTLTELSRKCGERRIQRNGHQYTVPLVTPHQLAGMKVGQALVLVAGSLQFITWLPHYTKMFDCSVWQAPVRQIRSESSSYDVFDIVKYTREKHSEPVEKKDIRFLENPPFYRPKPTNLPSFEEFMARVDKRLQEFDDEDEKIADAEQPEEENEQKQRPASGYEVRVISNRFNKSAVAKAISNTCGISADKALFKLFSLPAIFRFDTKEEAEALEEAVAAAHGIAIVEEQT